MENAVAKNGVKKIVINSLGTLDKLKSSQFVANSVQSSNPLISVKVNTFVPQTQTQSLPFAQNSMTPASFVTKSFIRASQLPVNPIDPQDEIQADEEEDEFATAETFSDYMPSKCMIMLLIK